MEHVPSFASPAHFRVFRQFMLDFVDDFGGEVHKVSASKAMRNHAHIEADAIAPGGRVDLDVVPRARRGAVQHDGALRQLVELSDTSDLRSGATTSKACAEETLPIEFGAQAARVAWRFSSTRRGSAKGRRPSCCAC